MIVDEAYGLLLHLGPVVQSMVNAIHRINHYPVDSVVCFVDTYPLDSGFIRWIALSTRRTTGPSIVSGIYITAQLFLRKCMGMILSGPREPSVIEGAYYRGVRMETFNL